MPRKTPFLLTAAITMLTQGCFEWAAPTQPASLAKTPGEAIRAAKSGGNAPTVPAVVKNLAKAHDDEPQDDAKAPASPQPTATAPTYSSGGGGGGGGAPAPTMAITDVLDAATGQSVMGANSPAALTGDVAGKTIRLTVKGYGFVKPEEQDGVAGRFSFELDPSFLTQTFVGNSPNHRVLLDDTIPMQPAASGTCNANELTVETTTQNLVDFNLAGLHTLTVNAGPQTQAKVQVRFASPATSGTLAPKITRAKLVNTDAAPEEWLVELKGANFPVDFRKAYAKINGTRAYQHATYVGASDSIAYVHVPEGVLTAEGSNSLTLITPFGVTFANF